MGSSLSAACWKFGANGKKDAGNSAWPGGMEPGKKGNKAGICWVVGVCLGGGSRGLRGKVLGGVGL